MMRLCLRLSCKTQRPETLLGLSIFKVSSADSNPGRVTIRMTLNSPSQVAAREGRRAVRCVADTIHDNDVNVRGLRMDFDSDPGFRSY